MLRLRQIALVARSLAPVEATIRYALGLEVAYRDPMVAIWGLENAVFPLGQQFLEVVAPVKDGTAAGRQLDRRDGDGGYMVILQCDDQEALRQRARELAIRTAFEHEDAGYRVWQLHPRDTGGAFLEIDFQPGGEDMNGPWQPAGTGWQSAARTDVVDAITAVEIQAADPEGLAVRWGALLDRPVERTSSGSPRLGLDNAEIRFVADADGRGEGLSGVDVAVKDRRRLVAALTSRGGRVSGHTIELGGVRLGIRGR